MTHEELEAIEKRHALATPPGRVIFEPRIIEYDVPALLGEVRRLRDRDAMRKRCPCEFKELQACGDDCSCRSSVMSGGCTRCATYGSYEQQLAMARRLVNALNDLS